MKALAEAKALVKRLETPWERMYDIVWIQPHLSACLRVMMDLSLFEHLSDTPQSSQELAGKVNADPTLVRRLLRLLVTQSVIEEGEQPNTYIDTTFSKALKDPQGLVNGLHVLYDASIPQQARLPAYLQSQAYQNPKDGSNPPWRFIENVPDFKGNRWDQMKATPGRYEHFNYFLSALRKDQPAWTELYPIQDFLTGWKPSTPLLVDVGGGNGKDISYLANALPKSPNSQTSSPHLLILQDRPEVIHPLLTSSTLPPQISPMEHNFFNPNPIPGARIYFLHAVLHDWADAEAHQILARVKEAMEPGYSRLILLENVPPERASEWSTQAAALDINMMCNFAALERTEEQWRELIEGVGLKWKGTKKAFGTYAFVEAEV